MSLCTLRKTPFSGSLRRLVQNGREGKTWGIGRCQMSCYLMERVEKESGVALEERVLKYLKSSRWRDFEIEIIVLERL